jgi:outer membrane protein assembly factor BamB
MEVNQVFRQERALLGITFIALFITTVTADDWAQFRGPNASGVSNNTGLPIKFGPEENVIWKTQLLPGHSSPVLTGSRIFVTAHAENKLFVLCLDRATGKILWRREVPRPRSQELHKSNSPASPSPVTDGQNVYAFFTDFGLISFNAEGKERWRLPLGPFNNPFGMGTSPILAEEKVLLNCDSETGSFFIAVDKNTGKVVWRVERPEATRGFSTPLLYKPATGPLQVIVAGSLRLSAYEVGTGKEVWWVRGLTWQLKPTPVFGQDSLFILGWAGGADPGQQEEIPPLEEVLRRFDANKDGKLSQGELDDKRIRDDWRNLDLDHDDLLNDREWRAYRAKRSVQNGVLAYRIDNQKAMLGDLTDSNFMWRYQRALPNVPSPLFYQDVLYLMKEGGILTALDPKSGAVLKQGRLLEAPGDYYASPVGADGKLYTVSEEGKVTVIKAGGNWEVLAVNDLDDLCHATPAISKGRIYQRTRNTLYCFGRREQANDD